MICKEQLIKQVEARCFGWQKAWKKLQEQFKEEDDFAHFVETNVQNILEYARLFAGIF